MARPDEDGHVLATWMDFVPGGPVRPHFAVFDASAPTAERVIHSSPMWDNGPDVYDIDIDASGAGYMAVAWSVNNGIGGRMYGFSVIGANNGFEEGQSRVLGTVPDTHDPQTEIVVAPDGKITVAWVDVNDAIRTQAYTMNLDGQIIEAGDQQFVANTSQPRELQLGRAYGVEPVLAFREAVWSGSAYGAVTYGGQWSGLQLLEYIVGDVNGLELGYNNTSLAMATWRHDSGGGLRIRTANQYGWGWWGSQLVDDGISRAATTPHIDVTEGGASMAVWREGNVPWVPGHQIMAAGSLGSGQWRNPFPLYCGDVQMERPRIAVDHLGRFAAAWYDSSIQEIRAVYQEY